MIKINTAAFKLMGDWELQYFSSRQAESEARCRQQSRQHTTSATRHTCAVAGSASRTELVPSAGTADPPGAATARLQDTLVLHRSRGADLCLCREKFAPQGCGHSFSTASLGHFLFFIFFLHQLLDSGHRVSALVMQKFSLPFLRGEIKEAHLNHR